MRHRRMTLKRHVQNILSVNRRFNRLPHGGNCQGGIVLIHAEIDEIIHRVLGNRSVHSGVPAARKVVKGKADVADFEAVKQCRRIRHIHQMNRRHRREKALESVVERHKHGVGFVLLIPQDIPSAADRDNLVRRFYGRFVLVRLCLLGQLLAVLGRGPRFDNREIETRHGIGVG